MPTKITWVVNPDGTPGETLNVVTGCTPISDGCANCYAERTSKRLKGRFGYPDDDPFRVTVHPEKLEIPAKRKKPTTFFLCSMGDLFHEDVPDDFILRVFDSIWQSQTLYTRGLYEKLGHTFLILTKRPNRMKNFFLSNPVISTDATRLQRLSWCKNLWLGVSVENQRTADERIPILLETPTTHRFVSVEPMLEPVDLYDCFADSWADQDTSRYEWAITNSGLDWVIAGGENGPGSRYCRPGWVLKLLNQCVEAKTPFFLKGFGECFKDISIPKIKQQVPWRKNA